MRQLWCHKILSDLRDALTRLRHRDVIARLDRIEASLCRIEEALRDPPLGLSRADVERELIDLTEKLR